MEMTGTARALDQAAGHAALPFPADGGQAAQDAAGLVIVLADRAPRGNDPRRDTPGTRAGEDFSAGVAAGAPAGRKPAAAWPSPSCARGGPGAGSGLMPGARLARARVLRPAAGRAQPVAPPAARAVPRAAARTAAPAAAPLRLTRRGRIVLGLAVAVLATVLVALLTAGPAGGMPRPAHPAARAGYRGMTQIVVQPGQTLWSIAAAAEPSADPRVVIQQIISANALGGDSVQAGQLLWVPRH